MFRQAIKLWSLSKKNIFGINVFKHSTDKSERIRYISLAIAIVFLLLMFEGYMIGTMYAYQMFGMGNIVPMYAYLVGSLLIAVFTFFKAGSIVFGTKTIDITISLPVSKTAIVLSRMMGIYTTNLMVAFLVGIPAIIVYSVFVKASLIFVLIYALAIFLMPLLPMVVTVGINAAVKAISSRMKHKSIVESVLMLVLALGLIVFLSLGGEKMENFDEEAIKELMSSLGEMIGGIYPPAAWANAAAVEADVFALVKLVVLSVVPICILIWVISHKFLEVISALNSSYTKRNYVQVNSKSSSVFAALLKKELKYYVSSSVYMINTIIGQFMMVLFSIVLLVLGVEKLEEQMHIHGVIAELVPFILAGTCCMMPTTSCSISLEGKTHYISRTLPIPTKLLYDSKIAMYLCICAPFYLISVITSAIAIHAVGVRLIWLIVVPAVFICFSGVVSLRINLKMPKFNWDNETVVVKQSATTLIGTLISIVSILITAVAYEFAPADIKNLVLAGILILLSGVGVFIYSSNSKIVV